MPAAGGRKRPKRNRHGHDFKEEITEQAQNGTIEVNLAFLEDQEIGQLLDVLNQSFHGTTTIRLGYNPRGIQGFKSLKPVLLDVCLQKEAMEEMRKRLTPRYRIGICRALGNALGKSPIQELEIGLDVTQQGLAVLGEALSESISIRKLSLAGSLIGDGIEGLKRGLIENTSLTHLDVSRCDIGNSGARSISATIKAHGNERMRHLWKETLRDYPGVRHSSGEAFAREPAPQKTKTIADVASRCGGLVSLNLSQNKIGFQGAIALRDALGIDWRMTHLNLSQNLLTGDSLAEFSDLMKDNQVMQEINLVGNTGVDEFLTKAGNTQESTLGKPVVPEQDLTPCEAQAAQDSDQEKMATGLGDHPKDREAVDDMQVDGSNDVLQIGDQHLDRLSRSPEAKISAEGGVKSSPTHTDTQQRGLKRQAHPSGSLNNTPECDFSENSLRKSGKVRCACGRSLQGKAKKMTKKKSTKKKAKKGGRKDDSMDLDFSYIMDSLTQVAEHLEALSSPQAQTPISTQQNPVDAEQPAACTSPRRKFNFRIPEPRGGT